MKPSILMVPFHYPPMGGSSGVQRSLFFSSALEDYDWQVLVLTAHSRVHPITSNEGLKDIPATTIVKRTWAIDVARHLPFGGRFPRILALPDRWSSWVLSAVLSGKKLIKKYRSSVIWTTYPIASSHLIGFCLHKLTGVSWIADFRDPMTEEGYPRNPTVFKCYRWLERKVMEHTAYVVVTTPGVKRVYTERYGEECGRKIRIIQNGFDESKFSKAESEIKNKESQRESNQPLRMIHSGVIYPEERNPEPLFSALSELKSENILNSKNFRLELRSAGHDDLYEQMLAKYALQDIVSLLPSIPHQENIEDMLSADALLLLQGNTCNEQIPAKAYEYIRSGKPVIALTDKKGDTGQLLTQLGIGTIAALESKDEIKQALANIREICSQFCPLDAQKIQSFSRQHQSKELAELLDTLN